MARGINGAAATFPAFRKLSFAERAVYGPGGTLTSAVMPGFTVDLDRIFAA